MEEHQHAHLGSPDLIRVLDLLPSPIPTAQIRCRLRQVPLGGPKTKYEALSYVWGAPKGDQPIICDGQRLLVTLNCHNALVQLRRRFRCRTLWVDAICINQKDDEISIQERNQQVMRMGEIFHRATCVVIWLGPNASAATVIRDAKNRDRMSRLSCFLYPYEPRRRLQWSTLMIPFAKLAMAYLAYLPGLLTVPCVARSLGYSDSDMVWHKLQLLQDPWFSRVWTVQEVAFARSAIVRCGRLELPWHLLGTVLCTSLARRHNSCRVVQFRCMDGYVLFEPFDGDLLAGGDTRPQQVVLFRSLPYLRCIDPHDKIFGLYALLRYWGVELAAPDYNREVTQLFQELVVYFIQRWGSLEALTITLPASSSAGLPSWTPDWLTAPLTHEYFDVSGTFDTYDVCYHDATNKSKAKVDWDRNRGSLRLKGKRVGYIKASVACSPNGPLDAIEPGQFTDHFRITQEWCQANIEQLGDYSAWSLEDIFRLNHSGVEKRIVDYWLLKMVYPDVEDAAAVLRSPGSDPQSISDA
ncbi:HET-domain-containing protein [Apiospora rasikravindrae]|uniref:HET-domain-containing protein n=1 Tax=Apiospora rasikravindrae TaxID=990691 RepID=A0ABR1SEQ7_9PEZI